MKYVKWWKSGGRENVDASTNQMTKSMSVMLGGGDGHGTRNKTDLNYVILISINTHQWIEVCQTDYSTTDAGIKWLEGRMLRTVYYSSYHTTERYICSGEDLWGRCQDNSNVIELQLDFFLEQGN